MVFYNFFLLIIAHAMLSSAEVSQEDLKKFAVANNKLAAKLYPRLIKGNTDNVFFCPASLMTGLGIFLYGARGNTQKQLHSVLGYKAACLPNKKVPATFNYMFTKRLPQNDPTTPNYTLSCADAALVAKKAELDDAFKKEVQKQYLATVASVDFRKTEVLALKINYFVAEKTRGKIRHVVNGVSPDTSALAVNAVYLKGKWETPFPSELTKSQPFYSPLGEQSVPFMHVSGPFPYTETDDYQAIFLPYVGRNVGLLLFLTRQKDGLSTLEKTMTPDMIVNVVNQLKSASAVVCIPKIGIQYFRNFTNDFKSLGATCAYDGSGDFSGISKNKHLAVSGPLHKAYLEIDEGDQDAGDQDDCDQPIDIPPAHSKEFTADHPFMFAVVDIRVNMLLFLGRFINV